MSYFRDEHVAVGEVIKSSALMVGGPLKLRQIRAIILLCEGMDEAGDSHLDAWDLALPIKDLLDTGVTLNDLRVLHASGYIDFRIEVTQPAATRRRFRKFVGIARNARLAFIATESAIEVCDKVRRFFGPNAAVNELDAQVATE